MINITFTFLCFCPLGLAIKLNFDISKEAYSDCCESVSSIQIPWDLTSKYDLNQERAVVNYRRHLVQFEAFLVKSHGQWSRRQHSNPMVIRVRNVPILHIHKQFIHYLEQCSLSAVMGAISRLKLREEVIFNHVVLNLVGHHTLLLFRHKLQVTSLLGLWFIKHRYKLASFVLRNALTV